MVPPIFKLLNVRDHTPHSSFGKLRFQSNWSVLLLIVSILFILTVGISCSSNSSTPLPIPDLTITPNDERVLAGENIRLELYVDGVSAPSDFRCFWSKIFGEGDVMGGENPDDDCTAIYMAPSHGEGEVRLEVIVDGFEGARATFQIIPGSVDHNWFIFDASERMNTPGDSGESYFDFARRNLIDHYLGYGVGPPPGYALTVLGGPAYQDGIACEDQHELLIKFGEGAEVNEIITTIKTKLDKAQGDAPLEAVLLATTSEILEHHSFGEVYRIIGIVGGAGTCTGYDWEKIVSQIEIMNTRVRTLVAEEQIVFLHSVEIYILGSGLEAESETSLHESLDDIRERRQIHAYFFQVRDEYEMQSILQGLAWLRAEDDNLKIEGYVQLGSILDSQMQPQAAETLFSVAETLANLE